MNRPISLTIAVVLQWVAAFAALFAGLDLFMSAVEMSTASTEQAVDKATALSGVTDVAASQLVSGTLIAGIMLLMIAVLRVILAVYLARGLSWARLVLTVLVVMNLLAGVAFTFQDQFWRGLPMIALELIVLWLLYNSATNDYIRARSNVAAPVS